MDPWCGARLVVYKLKVEPSCRQDEGDAHLLHSEGLALARPQAALEGRYALWLMLASGPTNRSSLKLLASGQRDSE